MEENLKTSVQEMKETDIELIPKYFLNLNPVFLHKMGIDKNHLPSNAEWIKKLQLEYEKHYDQKSFYYIIWQVNSQAIGHSNINDIHYGDSALMHLHLWDDKARKCGLGHALLMQTLPFYFKNFNLKKLICQPKADNIAPSKTLRKIGFELIKTYETVPGWLNFKQTVSRYELSKGQFDKVFRS